MSNGRRVKDYGADRSLLATARLVENLAYLMPALRTHAACEIAMVDGAPSQVSGAVEPSMLEQRSKPLSGICRAAVPSQTEGHGDELVDCGRPRPCPDHDSPVDLTSVESAVEARLRVERWIADVEAQCKLIASTAKEALDSGRRLAGTRLATPDKPRECRDGQTGKDGTIEWGDPLCVEPSEKSGLCSKHYMAWYRWRRATGVDTDGMFASVADRVTELSREE